MARSLVDNAADPQQVANGRRVQRDRIKRFRDALAAIAHTPDGAVLFEELNERAAFFQSSFSADPLHMAFSEGQRAVYATLVKDWLEVKPDALGVFYTKRAEQAKREPAKEPTPENEE